MPTEEVVEPPSETTARRGKIGTKRKLVFSLLVAILCYVVVESALTYLYLQGRLDPELIWVIERQGETRHMEAEGIRGYRISAKPARMLCITTDGRIESAGELRGNNQGFPDRDDFQAARTDANMKRLAVFGDSFTAGPYLELNWPDQVEKITRRRGQPLEMLNFSVFGGGLANWWSILTRMIERDDYQLDGVIFVVFVDDLQRTFYVCDDARYEQFPEVEPKLACGFSDSFDPTTFEDVNVKFMRHTRIVSPEIIDQALEGHWRPDFSRPFELFIVKRFRRLIGGANSDRESNTPATTGKPADSSFTPDQQQLISDIANYLKQRELPAWVYHFPAGSSVAQAREFAERLGATYVDASLAFQGLSAEEQDACWMIDGHWNQTGSDRFAEWFIQVNSGSQTPDAARRTAP